MLYIPHNLPNLGSFFFPLATPVPRSRHVRNSAEEERVEQRLKEATDGDDTMNNVLCMCSLFSLSLSQLMYRFPFAS